MYRNVNVVGYSPPLELDTRSYPYLRALAQHLYDFLVGLILFDGASYPLLVLAPKSFGALGMVGGNYELWCRDLAVTWGVPLLAVRIYWTITLAIMCHCGTTICWNVLAIWGIASGVYIPEEWPTLTRKPILSTSLNQFWSYRWHQTMRVSPRSGMPMMCLILTISGSVHLSRQSTEGICTCRRWSLWPHCECDTTDQGEFQR